MAIIKKNFSAWLLEQVREKSLLIKRNGNKVIVATTPYTVKEPTKAQQKQRSRFMNAVMFAKKQLKDPDLKAAYSIDAKCKGLPNAYNAAIADYFNPPVIHHIGKQFYKGLPGDHIVIDASDDFFIKSVFVEIYANDTLIESGEAEIGTHSVIYLTQVYNESPSGALVKVTVTDMAGNTVERSS